MNHPCTRRDVLRCAAALPFAGVAGSLRWLPDGDDAALIVLELEGGNDGLNTVIPLDDARYTRARPALGGVRAGAHVIGGGFALHPGLGPLAALVRDGKGAVIHGVGYPNPDRSHFRSRDIWHVADPGYVQQTAATTGWIGRAADWLAARGAAVPGLGVGSEQLPLLLQGRNVVVPVLQRLDDYQVLVDAAEGKSGVRREAVLDLVNDHVPAGAGDALGSFLADVARSAVAGAERLRERLAGYRAKAEYPQTELGQKLQLLARILVAGFGTRFFHVTLGGFDTHARQLPAHDALLRQVGAAIAALVKDLDAHGSLPRTVVLIHSEFGRRVAQNESQGTDHGAAAPVFLLGGGVKGGLHGKPPDLDDLDQGDLKVTCDFRAVYGAILRRMQIDEAAVLGASFPGLAPFA